MNAGPSRLTVPLTQCFSVGVLYGALTGPGTHQPVHGAPGDPVPLPVQLGVHLSHAYTP